MDPISVTYRGAVYAITVVDNNILVEGWVSPRRYYLSDSLQNVKEKIKEAIEFYNKEIADVQDIADWDGNLDA